MTVIFNAHGNLKQNFIWGYKCITESYEQRRYIALWQELLSTIKDKLSK